MKDMIASTLNVNPEKRLNIQEIVRFVNELIQNEELSSLISIFK